MTYLIKCVTIFPRYRENKRKWGSMCQTCDSEIRCMCGKLAI